MATNKEQIVGAIGAEYYGQEFYHPPGANGPAGPIDTVYVPSRPVESGPSGPIPPQPEQLEFPFMQDNDEINHPTHYTAGGIEVFDFIQSWGLDFAEGNVIKYVVRSPWKGNRLKDLKKARWYLNKLIERAEQDKSL